MAKKPPQAETIEKAAREPEPTDVAHGQRPDERPDDPLLAILPEVERRAPGVELFLEACRIYGINPTPGLRPAEIPDLVDPSATAVPAKPRFRDWPADPFRQPPVPERVTFVTAGGVKVTHPMDAEFEAVLRRWLHAWHLDPVTRQYVEEPLPDDLTLPRPAVTGLPADSGPRQAWRVQRGARR